MSTEELEAEALKLDPKARARTRLWADESERRDAEWDAKAGVGRPAAEVLRAARARLKSRPS